MISNIAVENMSHLANTFPTRNDPGDEESLHPSQMTKKRIKVMLFFFIPSQAEPQRDEIPPALAAVRVPKGVPVARLRLLIRHVEEQLNEIYGKSKRCNLVMVADEFSNEWSYSFDLPTAGVVYI